MLQRYLAFKYHYLFTVVLNIECFSVCLFFLSVMVFFALIYSQRMRETTIYFISCVHLLGNLSLSIFGWVGLKKTT